MDKIGRDIIQSGITELVIDSIKENRESYDMQDASDIQTAYLYAVEEIVKTMFEEDSELSSYVFDRINEN